ncbi:taste receptor type 2 member 39-like [Ascaphus truei]|uniref:taste receptor type 2 member 39-like n=1 Tax=Ascaphus truei TaxID=8439 RepID=UPI003F5AB129
MPSPLALIFIAIHSMEYLVGIVTSGFILMAIFLNKRKQGVLSPYNQVLLLTVFSNIFYQSIALLSFYCFNKTCLHVISELGYTAFLVFKAFIMYMNFWLIAWLCFFFYVKIASLKHVFLFRINLRLPQILPKLLLASALGCLLISFPIILITATKPSINATGNATMDYIGHHWITWCTSIFGCFLPLTLVAFSTSYTLISLFKLARRMGKTMGDPSKRSLQAHWGAARTMIFLLLLFVLFFLFVSLFATNNVPTKQHWPSLFFAFQLSHAPIQSFILITGNTKMRRAIGRVFCPTSASKVDRPN